MQDSSGKTEHPKDYGNKPTAQNLSFFFTAQTQTALICIP